MQLSVRTASADDAIAAEQLAQQAFVELRRIYRPKTDFATSSDSNSPWFRLVANMDGHVVGTLEYRLSRDRLQIRGLAVDANYRCQGVARALIDRVCRFAEDENLSVISLFTIKQTGNVAIFTRLGFRIVQEEPAMWAFSMCGEALHEVLMEKTV